MLNFQIREVKTNRDLGYVRAPSQKRAYAMALADQRDGIFCNRSPHGIKIAESGEADSWTENEETIIWF